MSSAISSIATRNPRPADRAIGGPLTDEVLLRIIAMGMAVGTPVLYVVALLISYVSGVGIANSFAIAIIPALFGGITFGGFAGLMRHLSLQDRAADAARSAASAARSDRTDLPAAA